MENEHDDSIPERGRGVYRKVHDRLEGILDRAGRPNADFSQLLSEIRNVTYNLSFPYTNPVDDAIFAVRECMGTVKFKKNRHNALKHLTTCKFADARYFDNDGSLKNDP